MATYPGGIFSPPSQVNGNILTGPQVAAMNDELVAIQTELAANPKRNALSLDFASVKDRMDQMDLRAIQNILINGGMEIWQREVTFNAVASSVYTADRWKTNYSGAPTINITREGTIIDSGLYSLKFDITAAGGATNALIYQLVENFQEYRGKTVSVYARVRCNVASKVRVKIEQAGTFSAYHTGDSTFQTLVVTGAIPGGASALQISIGTQEGDSPAVSTMYVDSVMLVVGGQAIAYVAPDPAAELQRCQRYYEKNYDDATFAGAAASIGSINFRLTGAITDTHNLGTTVVMKVRKRVIPTVTIYARDTGTANRVRNVLGAADLVVGAGSVGQAVFGVQNNSGGNLGAANDWYSYYYVADAEI